MHKGFEWSAIGILGGGSDRLEECCERTMSVVEQVWGVGDGRGKGDESFRALVQ